MRQPSVVNSPPESSDKPLTPRQAWQPLTPRGVAAFAGATNGRLLAVQMIVVAIVVGAVVWFLQIAWFPVISAAVEHLPPTGEIRHGTLSFGGASPQTLAENARLAIAVDVEHSRSTDRVADVTVVFEKEGGTVCGALGCRWVPFDKNYRIAFNRAEVEPAWGAWRGPILGMVSLLTIAFLFLSWWSVAFLYTPLVKLIAFFCDRIVTWRGAWRLSAAALLPGALLMALAIVLYGFGAVDLLRFSLLYLLHLLSGVVFVSTSPFFLPKVEDALRQKNPFRDLRLS